MKKVNALLCLLALILMSAGCEEDKYPDLEDGIYAEINTNKGVMVAKLYKDAAPLTVANFVALAEGEHTELTDSLQGKPFFDGLIFHRVIKDFMIQGGDFTGTGGGRAGYVFNQEVNDTLKHDEKGVLSMANAGPNTNGTQFFIMHKETPSLDMNYNVFGKVIDGLSVIDSIVNTPTAARNRPVDSMIMKTVRIIRKGKEAKKFDAMKTFIEESKASQVKREEEEKAAAQIAKERTARSMAFKGEKAKELKELKAKAVSVPNSEITIYVRKKGTGEKPNEGDQVLLDYSGFLENGTLFDTSILENAQNFDALDVRKERAGGYVPARAVCSVNMRSVQGFKDALLSMEYGQEIVAFMPSAVAYGERGGGPIPPNSDIVYEMKLMKVEEGK